MSILLNDFLSILPDSDIAPPWTSLSKAMDRVNAPLRLPPGAPSEWPYIHDLPRALTSNEKKILPRILSGLMTELQTSPQPIWFPLGSILPTIRVNYKGHSYRPEIARGGNPDCDIYYYTGGKKYLLNLRRGTESEAHHIAKEGIFEKILDTIATHIREDFLREWCSVPHKKGMHFKTIARNLFIGYDTDIASKYASVCDLIISVWSDYIQEQKERKQNAPEVNRKAIQERATREVNNLERYSAQVHMEGRRRIDHEEERLNKMKLRIEQQLTYIQNVKEKQSIKHNKLATALENARLLRSSTLLSGVCVSLNNHYKNTPQIKITENPFTNHSNNTFNIIQCLLTAQKTK